MKFIYGDETFLIEEAIKKIYKEKGLDPIFFDSTSSMSDILEEITTHSLRIETKLIFIIDHALINDPKKGELLLSELEYVDSTVDVNIICKAVNPKKTTKLFKWYETHHKVIEFKKLKEEEIRKYIEHYVSKRNGTISNLLITKLANSLSNDLAIITSELDKVLSYSPKITQEVIDKLITKYETTNEYAIPNAIIENNYNELIKAYNKKIALGIPPTVIIGQISDILSLASIIHAYRSLGYSNNNIASETGIHPFRIKLISSLLEKSSINKIQDSIKKFAQLDKEIKLGQVDPQVGLDNFIINYMK